MRTLLIIVMMALAPLRAWAGDAMAISMAAAQVAVTAEATVDLVSVAATLQDSGPGDADAVAHADCLGHGTSEVAVAQDAELSQDDAALAHCPTCSYCQACSSPGLAITANLTGLVRFAHVVPLSSGAHFSSAERAPGFKPPIS